MLRTREKTRVQVLRFEDGDLRLLGFHSKIHMSVRHMIAKFPHRIESFGQFGKGRLLLWRILRILQMLNNSLYAIFEVPFPDFFEFSS